MLRSSTRITVSDSLTASASGGASCSAPKSRVTVSDTSPVPAPGPRPQPAAASAAQSSAIATPVRFRITSALRALPADADGHPVGRDAAAVAGDQARRPAQGHRREALRVGALRGAADPDPGRRLALALFVVGEDAHAERLSGHRPPRRPQPELVRAGEGRGQVPERFVARLQLDRVATDFGGLVVDAQLPEPFALGFEPADRAEPEAEGAVS